MDDPHSWLEDVETDLRIWGHSLITQGFPREGGSEKSLYTLTLEGEEVKPILT